MFDRNYLQKVTTSVKSGTAQRWIYWDRSGNKNTTAYTATTAATLFNNVAGELADPSVNGVGLFGVGDLITIVRYNGAEAATAVPVETDEVLVTAVSKGMMTAKILA